MPVPLLIVSDAVSAPTGLGRIARDIALRVHINLSDVFKVATFGYGGPGSSKFPFLQYTATDQREFMLPELPDVWNDFAGTEKGVVLCIWDPSRMGWFASPETSDALAAPTFHGLRQWLMKPPFKRWIYAPVDGAGPEDRLTFTIMKALHGFDRILAYTKWGQDVIERTISHYEATVRNLDNLPHGIDTEIFAPQSDRKLLRSIFPGLTQSFSVRGKTAPIEDDSLLLGIVATNQSRKDWALGIETAKLVSDYHDVRLWVHTDKMSQNWDLFALLMDFGMLNEKTMISLGHLNDEDMASAYSACDVTLGIGPEGFGYPIFESVCCGTPCVHGNYGGAPEYLSHWPECLIEPAVFRYEGLHSTKRPVYRPEDFAAGVDRMIGKRTNTPNELVWANLWPRWEAWFRKAAKDL